MPKRIESLNCNESPTLKTTWRDAFDDSTGLRTYCATCHKLLFTRMLGIMHLQTFEFKGDIIKNLNGVEGKLKSGQEPCL
ncbi:hypothetical protein L596_013841 [Steinernema carpocapsae]|uniref:Uncharacterized protein n=1 Tax=Steinernema carpocapsae TaxID=34508 RepID=A0A4U5P2N5_STECR|nr:hypothetical protein L596_013841 [Steinernema carpocapsae]